jgi:hypothetical protein
MAKVKLCPKKLGKEIESLRGEMPLEQLSEASGLSVEYLRNLEAGDVQKVKKKELKRLGKALQMPTPCIKMMGLDPADVPDKILSQLAGTVQQAIKACIAARHETNGKHIDLTKEDDPANKKKKSKKK